MILHSSSKPYTVKIYDPLPPRKGVSGYAHNLTNKQDDYYDFKYIYIEINNALPRAMLIKNCGKVREKGLKREKYMDGQSSIVQL